MKLERNLYYYVCAQIHRENKESDRIVRWHIESSEGGTSFRDLARNYRVSGRSNALSLESGRVGAGPVLQ